MVSFFSMITSMVFWEAENVGIPSSLFVHAVKNTLIAAQNNTTSIIAAFFKFCLMIFVFLCYYFYYFLWRELREIWVSGSFI
ncbi:MAG: hypothetical protein EGQ57_01910 [Alphaproteobacteria bacterium]|nr:hypothetical protein [Alphaproteobacteria bacterium]